MNEKTMNEQSGQPRLAAFGAPLTPKEFGALIGRRARWVSHLCRRRKLPTCPPHTPPFLIPRNVLFKFGVIEKK
jgi:hypothetical protein